MGDVSGTVDATTGHASVSTMGGRISGSVTAGLSAYGTGFEGISGDFTAGQNVGLFSGNAITTTVSAGGSIGVFGLDTVGGTFTATDALVISAFGLIDGQTTADDVILISTAGVNGQISAGKLAAVISAGSTQVSGSAGEDFVVMSMGDSNNITASAGGDAVIWSAGSVVAAVNATRSVAVFTQGSFQGSADAGDDASVFAFQSLHAMLTGTNTVATTMGPASMASLTASNDAFLFAFDSATQPLVSAGRYAGLVTWGSAAPLALVQGPEGAFAFTYGTFNGEVNSTNGSASLVTLGGAFNTSVTAGTDAAVISAGMFMGSVTAGDSAIVVSLQDLNGSVSAGEHVVLLSEGTINATASAGNDLGVLAYGDVRGSYTAGADISVKAYGAVNAGISAAGHVSSVYAVDGIQGSVSASDVDTVFAHGQILSSINADVVGTVTAWGDIDGSISATESIGTVRSAASVHASLSAPQIGSVIENDPDLIASTPVPATPASVRADILADAAASRATMEADIAAAADDIATMKADLAAAKNEAANDIAQLKADIADAVAEARAAYVDWLANQKAAIEQELAQSRADSHDDTVDLRTAAIAAKNRLISDDRDAVVKASAALTDAQHSLRAVVDSLGAENESLQSQRADLVAAAQSALAQREQAWEAYQLVVRQQMADLIGERIQVEGESYWDTFLETWSWSEYFAGVGSVFTGYGNAATGTVSGIWQMVRHPIQTGKALFHAVVNWRQTLSMIKDDVVNKSGTLEGQGELFGDLLIGLVTGGALKAASKSGKVARLLDKFADAADDVPRSVDLMGAVGQLGGELFPAEKIPALVKYLERRNIYLYEGVNGSFDGVRGVMTLPKNPTRLNVRHELAHMLDYMKYGDDYYTLFTPGQREQMVLERLKNNRIWDMLNELERKWSLNYPSGK